MSRKSLRYRLVSARIRSGSAEGAINLLIRSWGGVMYASTRPRSR
jgi:hypothetical protein